MSVQEAVVIGGLDMQTQAKALAQRPHVVVATPGRLRVRLNACTGIPLPCMGYGTAWRCNLTCLLGGLLLVSVPQTVSSETEEGLMCV